MKKAKIQSTLRRISERDSFILLSVCNLYFALFQQRGRGRDSHVPSHQQKQWRHRGAPGGNCGPFHGPEAASRGTARSLKGPGIPLQVWPLTQLFSVDFL